MFKRRKEDHDDHTKEITKINTRLDKVEDRLTFLTKQQEVLRRESNARG